jgi:hypothetical protein
LESGDRERGVAMGAGYGLLVALYTLVSAGGIAWRINSALRNDFWRGGGGGGGGALDPVEAARVLQSLLQSSFTLALLGNLLLAFFLLITLCVKVRLSNPVIRSVFRSRSIQCFCSLNLQDLRRRSLLLCSLQRSYVFNTESLTQ